jgi:hypothetical protein
MADPAAKGDQATLLDAAKDAMAVRAGEAERVAGTVFVVHSVGI